MTPTRSLLCFDGSEHARAAIAELARIAPESTVDIVTVHSGALPRFRHAGLYVMPEDVVRIEQELQAEAFDIAARGVEIARDLGLRARPKVIARKDSTWRAIVELLRSGDYGLVVLGARGRSAIRTALLGGVSMAVVAHAPCPVLIVHAPSQQLDFSLTDQDVAEQLPALGTT